MAAIDMTGQKIGKLLVIEQDTTKKGGAAYWRNYDIINIRFHLSNMQFNSFL